MSPTSLVTFVVVRRCFGVCLVWFVGVGRLKKSPVVVRSGVLNTSFWGVEGIGGYCCNVRESFDCVRFS